MLQLIHPCALGLYPVFPDLFLMIWGFLFVCLFVGRKIYKAVIITVFLSIVNLKNQCLNLKQNLVLFKCRIPKCLVPSSVFSELLHHIKFFKLISTSVQKLPMDLNCCLILRSLKNFYICYWYL